MKILLLINVFLISSLISFAQIKESPEYKAGRHSSNSMHMLKDNGFIAVTQGGEVLQKYDENLKLVLQKEISLKYGSKNLDFIRLIKFNGENLIIAKQKGAVYASVLDVNSLTVSSKWKLVADMKKEAYMTLIKTSPDNSKLLVYFDFQAAYSDNEKVFVALNNNLKEIFRTKMTSNSKSKFKSIAEYQILNSGDLFISAYAWHNVQFEYFEYEYKLYKTNGSIVTVDDVKLENRKLKDIKSVIAKNGNILISGFYIVASNVSIEGCMYLEINPNGKIVNQIIGDFSLESSTTMLSEKGRASFIEKYKKGKKVSPKIYDIINIVELADGSRIIAGEHLSTTTSGQSGSTSYHRDDIVLLKVVGSEVKWMRSIPRIQSGQTVYWSYGSAKIIANDMNVNVYFNDYPYKAERPTNVEDLEALRLSLKSKFYGYTFDADGKRKYKELHASIKDNFQISISQLYHHNGFLLLQKIDGKMHKFCKMPLN